MFARLRPAPFALSLLSHGVILAWVASGPVREEPKSLYAQAIAPHSSKLVWYDFRKKLPDVSPAHVRRPATAPRADVKIASQEIVAGSQKAPRAGQFVWQPAPKLELKHDLRSPNVLAFHPPRAEPPPKPKLFVPPPEAPKAVVQAPALAAAPEMRAAGNLRGVNAPGMRPVRAQPRTFVAPAESKADLAAPALPAAPAVATAANPRGAAPLAVDGPAPAPHRTFVPPREGARPSPFGPPLPDAPALPEQAAASTVSVAIVGLNPSANAPAPVPEGSRDARLAAGPQPRPAGGLDGSAPGAMLSVPGLLIRNAAPDTRPAMTARAAPTSTGNLRAALRTGLPESPAAGPHPPAVRVSHAPDPMLDGRATYAMTVQMPNTTSYSGSWMIWFAEHQHEPGAGKLLSAPVPLRKVDPKYYPAAIADRVEGRVRLAAVIRKDGRVDSVKLLEHLDDRLDRSAQEAMAKWEFEPALREGQPVDIDAVIEIPFRLAPRVPK